MSARTCPECGRTEFAEAGGGRLRCSGCGATLGYRIQWLPLVGTALLVSAALGVVSALVFEGKAGFMIGPLAFLTVLFTARRFRTLRKV
jgi:hypothetical protein